MLSKESTKTLQREETIIMPPPPAYTDDLDPTKEIGNKLLSSGNSYDVYFKCTGDSKPTVICQILDGIGLTLTDGGTVTFNGTSGNYTGSKAINNNQNEFTLFKNEDSDDPILISLTQFT